MSSLRALAVRFGGPAVAAGVTALEAVVTVGEAALSDGSAIAHAQERSDIKALVTRIRAESKELAAQIAAS